MSSEKNNKPTFTADDESGAAVAAAEQAAIDGTSEAAGYATRENLARKAEKLIAKANQLLEEIGTQTADSAALEIDREVRQALNEVNEVYVSNQQAEFAYAWVFRDPRNEFGGRYVRKMQALGWELVTGDDPEAREHKFVDNTRVVADCLLMRIRLDRRVLLDKRDRLLRQAQQEGITARVADLAERAGTQVYDKLPGFVEEQLSNRSSIQRNAQAEFNRRNVGGKMDRMLRSGSIPGIPAPGSR